jgi:hypothetical protein
MLFQSSDSDYAALKDIAAAVQSFAIALAALFGGIWGLYTFRAKRDRDKADAELLELHRKLKVQARIVPSMTITTMRDGQALHLSVVVNLQNIGSRDIRINFSDRTLAIAKLGFDEHSKFKVESLQHSSVIGFDDITQSTLWSIPYLILDAGSNQSISFSIRLQSGGLYYVSFLGDLTGPESGALPSEAGGEVEHAFGVAIWQYVLVESQNHVTTTVEV